MIARIVAVAVLTISLGLAAGPVWAGTPMQKDPALVARAQRAVDDGLRWLRSVQKPDGTWGGHLGGRGPALRHLC